MSAPPCLLHFRISHYNEKVRWALDFKEWPHTRTSYTPGFHLLPMRIRTGQRQLPVLLIDGEKLVGSSHILDEIERRRPDPPLFPADAAGRERAMKIQKLFDDEVAPEMRRLFWSSYLDQSAYCTRMATMGTSWFTRSAFRVLFPMMRPLIRRNIGVTKVQIEQALTRVAGYFDKLESEIGPSGYLVGDSFGIADLCAAAIMTAIIRPPQFSYPLPEPWPPELVKVRGTFEKHRAFQWVLDIYAKHRGKSAEIAPLAKV